MRKRVYWTHIAVARALLCPKSTVSVLGARGPAACECYREPWPVRWVIYKLLISDALLHVSLTVSVHTESLLSDWQHTVHSVVGLMCSGCGLMTCNRGPCVFVPHTKKCRHATVSFSWRENLLHAYTCTPTYCTCAQAGPTLTLAMCIKIVLGK